MLKLRSPGKINLFLKILNRRSDGYHEIASLFQTIDLFDEISFTPSDKDVFSCSNPSVPTTDQNLILKAMALFRKKTGYLHTFSIHLEKKIPLEAGLGGGSSNAATTLWAMNEFSGRVASNEQLLQWGAEIGSDIPFFLSHGTAYCTGRGEKIEEIDALPFYKNYTLYKPNFGLSTAVVYKNLCLKNLVQRNPKDDLDRHFNGKPLFYNDLESVALSICPELLDFKNQLSKFDLQNLTMTGSGATFFCTGFHKLDLAIDWQCNVNVIQRNRQLWY